MPGSPGWASLRPESPQLRCLLFLRSGALRARPGLGQKVLLGHPVVNLLEGCWQFFLFSTTLLFLMIVHDPCICSPCSSSRQVGPMCSSRSLLDFAFYKCPQPAINSSLFRKSHRGRAEDSVWWFCSERVVTRAHLPGTGQQVPVCRALREDKAREEPKGGRCLSGVCVMCGSSRRGSSRAKGPLGSGWGSLDITGNGSQGSRPRAHHLPLRSRSLASASLVCGEL